MCTEAENAEAAIPIRLSRDNLLVIGDPKCMDYSTTSNSYLLILILGDVVTCANTFDFFLRLIVRPNAVHALAKRPIKD